VPDDLSDARNQVAIANRILANEGVFDAFGHVSVRHPTDPRRYLLPRSRSPGLIEPADVLEFTLDSEPVTPPTVQLYAERVIHGCIYEARPDVMAVCHHHAPAVMPFCISGVPLIPVIHVAAIMGATVPFWDQRECARAGVPLDRHVPERRIPDARAGDGKFKRADAGRDQARRRQQPLA